MRESAPALRETHGEKPPMLAYGTSGRVRDFILVIIPHAAHVDLQFADGAHLPDEHGLLEGTGKKIRHVKVRRPEDAADQRLRALLRAQLEARRLA